MTPTRTLVMLITLICIAGIGAVAFSNQPQSATIDQERIREGIAVYRANYCGSCHTLTIANTRGIFGPNHDEIVAEASRHIQSSNYSGMAETVDAYIRESIVDPTIFYTPGYETTNHHMPAFGHLDDQAIDAMVYMLVHQADYDASTN